MLMTNVVMTMLACESGERPSMWLIPLRERIVSGSDIQASFIWGELDDSDAAL